MVSNFSCYVSSKNVTNVCFNDTNFTLSKNVSVKLQGHAWGDCDDNIMSIQTFTAVDKAVACGLVPSLFLVGVPTNILSTIIFYRQGLRDQMHLCLFCLAFVDLMYLAAEVLASSCLIGIFLPQKELFWRLSLTAHVLNFLFGFSYSSRCLKMIIAIERCVCVMFPMKVATLISTKAMVVVILLIFFFIQLLCVVYIIKLNDITVKDDGTSEVLVVSVVSDLYLRYSIFKIVENIVLSCICFLNFASVLIATLITVIRLHTAETWRKSTSSHIKGQGKLMKMLVALSFVYILCTAPDVVLALTRLTVPEFRADGDYCRIFVMAHRVRHAIVMLHSSSNFFVYVKMSSRFRQELKLLCDTRPLRPLKRASNPVP